MKNPKLQEGTTTQRRHLHPHQAREEACRKTIANRKTPACKKTPAYRKTPAIEKNNPMEERMTPQPRKKVTRSPHTPTPPTARMILSGTTIAKKTNNPRRTPPYPKKSPPPKKINPAKIKDNRFNIGANIMEIVKPGSVKEA